MPKNFLNSSQPRSFPRQGSANGMPEAVGRDLPFVVNGGESGGLTDPGERVLEQIFC
jgi:hypothetical protein